MKSTRGLLAAAVLLLAFPIAALYRLVFDHGLLGSIFLIQGASELLHNASLTRVAYQVLGQGLERWLFDVFALWCIAVLLADSQGKTRIGGGIALGLVACLEVFAVGLSLSGTSLADAAPWLFVLYFLPFVWLLAESRTTRWRVP